MATSQNGWAAITSGTDSRLTPLAWITGRVLAGDVHTVLDHLAARYDTEVEPIIRAHSWGWAYRPVTGGTSLSNHASGTAIDLNAPAHPLDKTGTFTPAQRAAIHRILADLGGVVRWGGDYTGRVDEMHFEIVTTPTQVAALAERIRTDQPTTTNDPNTTPRLMEDNMVRIRHNSGAIYLVDVRHGTFRALDATDNLTLDRLGIDIVWDQVSDFERDQVRQLVRDYSTPAITA